MCGSDFTMKTNFGGQEKVQHFKLDEEYTEEEEGKKIRKRYHILFRTDVLPLRGLHHVKTSDMIAQGMQRSCGMSYII